MGEGLDVRSSVDAADWTDPPKLVGRAVSWTVGLYGHCRLMKALTCGVIAKRCSG